MKNDIGKVRYKSAHSTRPPWEKQITKYRGTRNVPRGAQSFIVPILRVYSFPVPRSQVFELYYRHVQFSIRKFKA